MDLHWPRHSRHRLAAAALAALLAGAGPAPATAPATAPAASDPAARAGGAAQTRPAISPAEHAMRLMVAHLGADDFATREKASRQLGELGDKALPTLRWGTQVDDPEIARRCQNLLDDFAQGLRPDTPQMVRDLLGQYRAASGGDRLVFIQGLANQGSAGARVLLALYKAETSTHMQRLLLKSLADVSRPAASQLLLRDRPGDVELAEQVMETAALADGSAARDRAAYLTLGGKAAAAIEQLRADHKTPEPVVAFELACLYRAVGDIPSALASARRAAGAGGEEPAALLDALLVESRQWKELVAELQNHGNIDNSIEILGHLAAYSALDDDTAGVKKWTEQILNYAGRNPDDVQNAAVALLLADKPDEAVDLYVGQAHFGPAMDLLNARLGYADALQLFARAKSGSPSASARAQAAEALHFQGKSAEAAAELESIAGKTPGELAFRDWESLVAAARETNQPVDRIDAWCAEALGAFKQQDGIAEAGDPRAGLLEKAGFAHPERAVRWWPILRARHAQEEPAATFHQLRLLDANRWPPAELDLFAGDLIAKSFQLPIAQREEELSLVGRTLADAGRTEQAARAFGELERLTHDPDDLRACGDFEAGQKHWRRAADLYRHAAALAERRLDHPLSADATDQPLVLVEPSLSYLSGWATRQEGAESHDAGMEKEGSAMMARADLSALGDSAARKLLLDAMTRLGLTDEASRERELLVRTGNPLSQEAIEALSQQAEDASAAGKPMASALLWERALLSNQTTLLSFVEPSSNLMVAALVEQCRAQGLILAGKIEPGMKAADASFQLCPGDADGQIALVTCLQDHGHRAQADVIYQRALGAYRKLLADHPDSAPANNLVAWFEGRCRRDLDDALAKARKAVDLEPTNAGILDTLAEVYFQRGQRDEAVATARKCLELDPGIKHYRDSIKRFSATK